MPARDRDRGHWLRGSRGLDRPPESGRSHGPGGKVCARKTPIDELQRESLATMRLQEPVAFSRVTTPVLSQASQQWGEGMSTVARLSLPKLSGRLS